MAGTFSRTTARSTTTWICAPVSRAVGAELLELPLSLEDSWLFRDWRLSVPDGLAYAGRVLDRAIEEGGLVVIDTHPSILADHPGFHEGFLDLVTARSGDVWCPSPFDLAAFLEPACAA